MVLRSAAATEMVLWEAVTCQMDDRWDTQDDAGIVARDSDFVAECRFVECIQGASRPDDEVPCGDEKDGCTGVHDIQLVGAQALQVDLMKNFGWLPQLSSS